MWREKVFYVLRGEDYINYYNRKNFDSDKFRKVVKVLNVGN